MILIIGFTGPPTINFKFITECDNCYYKVRQLILLQSVLVCYYKVRQLFYYKERQVLLQSATILLQSVIGITKCDRIVYREKCLKISFFILAPRLYRLRLAQMNNGPRANVFPAGKVNFEQAVYRPLERSPQDTRDGF